jgi:ribonuclease J
MIVHTATLRSIPPPSPANDRSGRFADFGEARRSGLLSDSTNVENEGYSISESRVGERLDSLFNGSTQRIIVTTFASTWTGSSR